MFLNFKDQYNGILLNYQNIILGKFYERHKILYIHFQSTCQIVKKKFRLPEIEQGKLI